MTTKNNISQNATALTALKQTIGISNKGRTDINYVFEGDSRTSVGTNSQTEWPLYLSNLSKFKDSGNFHNVATYNNRLSDIVSQYATEVYPLRPNGTTVVESYLFVLVCINDIMDGTAAADLITTFMAYCDQATADGFKVIPFTTFYDQDATYLQEQARLDFNDLLRSNTDHFYALIDLEQLFPPSASNIFYYDVVHLKSAGNKLIAEYVNWIFQIGIEFNSVVNRLAQQNVFTSTGDFRFDGNFKLYGRYEARAGRSVPMIGGTNDGSLFLSVTDGANTGKYGLMFGVSGDGNGWIQEGRIDSETYYNLLLQARGGNLGIGYLAGDEVSKYRVAVNGRGFFNNAITIGTQALKSTPEGGDIEFDGTNLYFTRTDGTRKQIAVV